MNSWMGGGALVSKVNKLGFFLTIHYMQQNGIEPSPLSSTPGGAFRIHLKRQMQSFKRSCALIVNNVRQIGFRRNLYQTTHLQNWLTQSGNWLDDPIVTRCHLLGSVLKKGSWLLIGLCFRVYIQALLSFRLQKTSVESPPASLFSSNIWDPWILCVDQTTIIKIMKETRIKKNNNKDTCH